MSSTNLEVASAPDRLIEPKDAGATTTDDAFIPAIRQYPLVVAHASASTLSSSRTLLEQARNASLSASALVQALLCYSFTDTKKQDLVVSETLQQTTAQVVYPSVQKSECVFVASSMQTLFLALMQYIHEGVGSSIARIATRVLVPGLLTSPHQEWLSILKDPRWQQQAASLEVVGYDLNVDKMEIDLKHLQSLLNESRDTEKSVWLKSRLVNVVVIAAVRGRFPANAGQACRIAKKNISSKKGNAFFSASPTSPNGVETLILEVHLPTIQPLTKGEEGGTAAAADPPADLVVTSFDGPGFLGGAVVYAPSPELAAVIQKNIQSLPSTGAMRKLVCLLRHVSLLMVSNRLDFGYIVLVISMLIRIGRVMGQFAKTIARKEIVLDEKEQKASTEPLLWVQAVHILYGIVIPSKKTKPVRAALPSLFLAPRWLRNYSVRWPSWLNLRESVTNRRAQNQAQQESHSTDWIKNFIVEQSRHGDAQRLSLWSFLYFLPSYITVVSAGEPNDPERCVEMVASNIILRAVCPRQVVQRLRHEGFAAMQAHAVAYRQPSKPPRPALNADDNAAPGGNKHAYNITTGDASHDKGTTFLSHYVEEVVYFENCPQCRDAAPQLVFVPLAPHMNSSAHVHLLRTLSDMPPSWWCRTKSSLTSTMRPYTEHPYSTPAVRRLLNDIVRRYRKQNRADNVNDGGSPNTCYSTKHQAQAKDNDKAGQPLHRLCSSTPRLAKESLGINKELRISDLRVAESVLYREYSPLLMYLLYTTQTVYMLTSML